VAETDSFRRMMAYFNIDAPRGDDREQPGVVIAVAG